eukprot:jgi/Ulvmu1/9610/UM054_0040.1
MQPVLMATAVSEPDDDGSVVLSPTNADNTRSATSPTPANEFQDWCNSMGMLPEAASGWVSLCRQPKQCCLLFFASEVAFCLIFGILYVGATPWPNWRAAAVHGVLSIGTGMYMWGMYRMGPAFARSTRSKWLTTLCLVTLGSQIGFSFAVPDHNKPFQDRMLATVFGGLGGWFLILAGMCGAVAAAHPLHPHSSVRTPIAEATLIALRIMNTLTDIGLIPVMLHTVEGQCYWYGRPGPCSRNKALAAIAAVFASAQLLKTVAMVFMHRLAKQDDEVGRRLSIGSAAVTLTSEIGIVTITLLKLSSDARTTATVADSYAVSDSIRADVTFTIISLLLSICAFCVSAIGVRKVLAATMSVARRLTERMSQNAPTSARAGARSVFPAPPAADALEVEHRFGMRIEAAGLEASQHRSVGALPCRARPHSTPGCVLLEPTA